MEYAVIGSLVLAGYIIFELSRRLDSVVKMATRKPYWIVEQSVHGIRNVIKLESRVATLESRVQTIPEAITPDWENPGESIDQDVESATDEVVEIGERG